MTTLFVYPQSGYIALLKALYIANTRPGAETLIAMVKFVPKNKRLERIRLPAHLRSFSFQNLVTHRIFVSCHKTIFFFGLNIVNLRTRFLQRKLKKVDYYTLGTINPIYRTLVPLLSTERFVYLVNSILNDFFRFDPIIPLQDVVYFTKLPFLGSYI